MSLHSVSSMLSSAALRNPTVRDKYSKAVENQYRDGNGGVNIPFNLFYLEQIEHDAKISHLEKSETKDEKIIPLKR